MQHDLAYNDRNKMVDLTLEKPSAIHHIHRLRRKLRNLILVKKAYDKTS